jgi:hypothetical protein
MCEYRLSPLILEQLLGLAARRPSDGENPGKWKGNAVNLGRTRQGEGECVRDQIGLYCHLPTLSRA